MKTLDFVGGSTSDVAARGERNVITGASHTAIAVALHSSPAVRHLRFARVATARGSYYATDSIRIRYVYSRCFGPDLSEASLDWFEGLDNLDEVTICTVAELPSDVSAVLKGRGVVLNAISECGLQEGRGRRCDKEWGWPSGWRNWYIVLHAPWVDSGRGQDRTLKGAAPVECAIDGWS